MVSVDSFNVRKKTTINGCEYIYYDITALVGALGYDIKKMPISLRILLENIVRNENGLEITQQTILDFVEKFYLLEKKNNDVEVFFYPSRILMQDFTGVPVVADLASMRQAASDNGASEEVVKSINPQLPVHIVVDHSIQVDSYGNSQSLAKNMALEMSRNVERYEAFKWAQNSLENMFIVPPGKGICHQVNLEYIAKVVVSNVAPDGLILSPDTVVGTDSHTTMINGLGVLGWGVGGIEAEAAMLGQGMGMLIPEVVGCKLVGKPHSSLTATDIVLTITNVLRAKGVVGKFVEFYGEGLDYLTLADRATIANMAPEYGATCGFFAVDDETLSYLDLTARSEEDIEIVEQYSKINNLYRESGSKMMFNDIIEVDISKIDFSLAGPERPQDRVDLRNLSGNFLNHYKITPSGTNGEELTHGSVVIAAITSCTNTSNPASMIAAGLLAKKACEMGLQKKSFVKTSLSPGSRVVESYLINSGLLPYLEKLGFYIAGYGCMTCIGNSGPLDSEVEIQIQQQDLTVAAVLSGNRNFTGRVHNLVRANYLASPMLVVAYALIGNLGIGNNINSWPKIIHAGKEVSLEEIIPTREEIGEVMEKVVTKELFAEKYRDIYEGDALWREIAVPNGLLFPWKTDSTYIENPPYFDGISLGNINKSNVAKVENARCLLLLGDSVTTDHISPAGNIAKNSPAAKFLRSKGVQDVDFNAYGTRRGAHNVMIRGTFANVKLNNKLNLIAINNILELWSNPEDIEGVVLQDRHLALMGVAHLKSIKDGAVGDKIYSLIAAAYAKLSEKCPNDLLDEFILTLKNSIKKILTEVNGAWIGVDDVMKNKNLIIDVYLASNDDSDVIAMINDMMDEKPNCVDLMFFSSPNIVKIALKKLESELLMLAEDADLSCRGIILDLQISYLHLVCYLRKVAAMIAINSSDIWLKVREAISKTEHNLSDFWKMAAEYGINKEGPYTICLDVCQGSESDSNFASNAVDIYSAVQQYNAISRDLIIVAGKEYGTGSSRDWAAKGTKLLGVKAVIAESFERIHRSNLVGMGVLPLQFTNANDKKLIIGDENFALSLESGKVTALSTIKPKSVVYCKIEISGAVKWIKLQCRIDTERELSYYLYGGVMPYVLAEKTKD